MPSPWDAIAAMVAGWIVAVAIFYPLGVRDDAMGVCSLGGALAGGLVLVWWYGYRDSRGRR